MSYTAVKVGSLVTLQLSGTTVTVAGSQAQITYNATTLAVGYRPAVAVEYPMMFVSGGTTDTGLVGTISISTIGVVTFIRDKSLVQQFTGVSGIANGWSVSYIVP